MGNRRRRSVVWPLLLVGVGVILLMANLDLLAPGGGAFLVTLWPLVLVLIGFDIIVGQRSTIGMLLSGALTLAALVGVVALLLLGPAEVPLFRDLYREPELHRQVIDAPLGSVERAQIRFDFGAGVYSIEALSPESGSLLEGDLEYFGELILDVSTDGEQAEVLLDSQTSFRAFSDAPFQEESWQVGLHPAVIYEAEIDSGSGRNDLNLAGLQLGSLELDTGSGGMALDLPAGDYTVVIDSGSGDIRISLPSDIALRVDVDSGSGRFRPDSALQLVRGDEGDDSVWETAGYDQAERQVSMTIDQGSGDVEIEFR